MFAIAVAAGGKAGMARKAGFGSECPISDIGCAVRHWF